MTRCRAHLKFEGAVRVFERTVNNTTAIMTYPEWRDAFWAELERVMGVPGTVNDDQRQIGGWIITIEPWAASYAVVKHAEALAVPAASVTAGGVNRYALVVDVPRAAARRFATALRGERPDLWP